MKGKSGTYILLIGAAGLWGYIIWKVVAGLNSRDGQFRLPEQKEVVYNIDIQQFDSVALLLDYEDPFLKRTIKPKTSLPETSAPAKKTPKRGSTPNNSSWPEIEFKGSISNEQTGTGAYVIKIGNKEFVVTSGFQIGDVSVVKVSPTSIRIRYKKEERDFPLSPGS